MAGTSPAITGATMAYAAGRISAASGNSVTVSLSLSIIRNKSKYRMVGGSAGPSDHRLSPFFVMDFLRCLNRGPDIDAGNGFTVEFKQKMFSQQFLVGAPFRN